MGMESSEFGEAEKLLERVGSWSEEELEDLPELYRRKAKEFRVLVQDGEE